MHIAMYFVCDMKGEPVGMGFSSETMAKRKATERGRALVRLFIDGKPVKTFRRIHHVTRPEWVEIR